MSVSQAAIGQLVGVTGSAVSNYATGRRVPSLTVAVALSRAMGAPLLGNLVAVVENRKPAKG